LSTKVLAFYIPADAATKAEGTRAFLPCLTGLQELEMKAMTRQSKNLLTVAFVAALSAGMPPVRAADKETPSKPAKAELPQLQLTVDVPPNWRPFLADDLAEAFASRVSDVFRRRGYAGTVRFIDRDAPAKETPVLAIRLITWRIGRTDSAECTFTAALTAGGQEHALGIFENTALVWNRGLGRWALADALGDVADGALRDLSARLAHAAFVPGFTMAR
jgi:hypothetical protein